MMKHFSGTNHRPTSLTPAISAVVVALAFGLVVLPSKTAVGQENAAAANESPDAAQADAAKDKPNEASSEEQSKSAAEDKQPAKTSDPKADGDAAKMKSGNDQPGAADDPKESQPKESQPEKTEPNTQPEEKPAAEPGPDPEWKAKGVWTLPPTDGPAAIDFSLVGEYLGDVKSGDNDKRDGDAAAKTRRLGVQIRNLGKGEFEARAYAGGLPGQESFEDEKPMLLFGRRSGSTLVLSGGPWAMFAGAEECKIIDETGTTLAKLPRVERSSPTLGATPPEGAMVLFDGTDTNAFAHARMTEDKLLAQGANINFMLNDFDLHLEFRIPHMPAQREQRRGNSGIYLQGRYECQVLDSFGDAKVFNGLGALYRHKAPKFNMALPPLVWQTYDIHFTAARFAADGSKIRNARISSWVNGVKVQDDEELPGPTGHGKPESPTLLPTLIQDHGDPVRFRNIWVIDRGLSGGIEFPQMADTK